MPTGLTLDETTGVISGTLAADASQGGPYTVTVTASDGSLSVDDSFDFTVTNVAPEATDDSYTVAEDGTLTITVADPNDLLDNDADGTPDSDALTIISNTDPANGSVTVNADGSFEYTPNANYHGPDSFSYTVSDGNGGEETATVNITVTPVSDAPVVGDATGAISEEGLTGALPDNAGNPSDTTNAASMSGTIAISDPEGDTVEVSLSSSASLSSGGEAVAWSGGTSGTPLIGTINGGATEVVRATIDDSGNYQVTLSEPLDHPVTDAEDLLSFDITVTASDGVESSSGTLTVTVEDDSPTVEPAVNNVFGDINDDVAFNILVVLDVSGSMNNDADGNGVGTESRLDLAKDALNDFAATLYNETDGVSITLITFSSGAQSQGVFTTLSDFSTAINDLTAGGSTNYNASLQQANNVILDQLTQDRPDTLNDLLYFISDGRPTSGGDVDVTLLTNGIADDDLPTVFSIGVGAGVDEVNLDLVIPGVQQGDANGDPIIVDEFGDLGDTLNGLIVNGSTVEGNLFSDSTIAGPGADGGGITSVTFGGTVYTIESSEVSGTLLSATNSSGTLNVDFANGDYIFFGDSNTLSSGDQVEIGFTLSDNDGDTASSTLVISIGENQAPEAEGFTLVTNGVPGSATILGAEIFDYFGTDPESEQIYLFDVAGGAAYSPYDEDLTITDDFEYRLVDDRGTASDTAAVDLVRDTDNAIDGTAGRDLLVNSGGSIALDVRQGSTYNSTTLFGVSLSNVAAGLSVTQIVIDLSGINNARFDPNEVNAGGTPFNVGEANGIDASDISSSLSNSDQVLTIDIASGALESGDGFRFGIDTDVNSVIGEGEDFGIQSVPVQVTLSDGSVINGNFINDSTDTSATVFQTAAETTITLDGGAGDDVLLGNDGNEILLGGSGEDVLFDGAGNDILTGGADADLFIIGGGDDRITDYNQAEGDIIDLSELVDIEAGETLDDHLSVLDDGSVSGETVIEVNDTGDTVTFEGIVLSGASNSDLLAEVTLTIDGVEYQGS